MTLRQMAETAASVDARAVNRTAERFNAEEADEYRRIYLETLHYELRGEAVTWFHPKPKT